MHILNVEDDAVKHHKICKVLNECGITNIEWSRNLQNALEQIHSQSDAHTPYSLVITDMWYPKAAGEKDTESGSMLIQIIQKEKLDLPVIVCSSIPYQIPGIAGSIWYSEKRDWESELKELIREI
jgi:DNA-binding NtrC family response regulator